MFQHRDKKKNTTQYLRRPTKYKYLQEILSISLRGLHFKYLISKKKNNNKKINKHE